MHLGNLLRSWGKSNVCLTRESIKILGRNTWHQHLHHRLHPPRSAIGSYLILKAIQWSSNNLVGYNVSSCQFPKLWGPPLIRQNVRSYFQLITYGHECHIDWTESIKITAMREELHRSKGVTRSSSTNDSDARLMAHWVILYGIHI